MLATHRGYILRHFLLIRVVTTIHFPSQRKFTLARHSLLIPSRNIYPFPLTTKIHPLPERRASTCMARIGQSVHHVCNLLPFFVLLFSPYRTESPSFSPYRTESPLLPSIIQPAVKRKNQGRELTQHLPSSFPPPLPLSPHYFPSRPRSARARAGSSSTTAPPPPP